jgi:hypothetical protein
MAAHLLWSSAGWRARPSRLWPDRRLVASRGVLLCALAMPVAALIASTRARARRQWADRECGSERCPLSTLDGGPSRVPEAAVERMSTTHVGETVEGAAPGHAGIVRKDQNAFSPRLSSSKWARVSHVLAGRPPRWVGLVLRSGFSQSSRTGRPRWRGFRTRDSSAVIVPPGKGRRRGGGVFTVLARGSGCKLPRRRLISSIQAVAAGPLTVAGTRVKGRLVLGRVERPCPFERGQSGRAELRTDWRQAWEKGQTLRAFVREPSRRDDPFVDSVKARSVGSRYREHRTSLLKALRRRRGLEE